MSLVTRSLVALEADERVGAFIFEEKGLARVALPIKGSCKDRRSELYEGR